MTPSGDNLDSSRRELERRFFVVWERRDPQPGEEEPWPIAEVPQAFGEELLRELCDAGVQPDALVALMLAPLVAVVWADGEMADEEREAALLAVTRAGLCAGSPAYRLFESWLRNAETDTLLTAWRQYVRALQRMVSAETAQALKNDLMGRAMLVAQAKGGVLGFGSISQAERHVLEEMAKTFQLC